MFLVAEDKEDCFARKGKLCSCLQEINFKAGCPFYKSKKQYEIELKKYPRINKKRKKK